MCLLVQINRKSQDTEISGSAARNRNSCMNYLLVLKAPDCFAFEEVSESQTEKKNNYCALIDSQNTAKRKKKNHFWLFF